MNPYLFNARASVIYGTGRDRTGRDGTGLFREKFEQGTIRMRDSYFDETERENSVTKMNGAGW